MSSQTFDVAKIYISLSTLLRDPDKLNTNFRKIKNACINFSHNVVNIDERNKYGRTLMHEIINMLKVKNYNDDDVHRVIECILVLNPNVTIKDCDENTPIDLCDPNWSKTIKLLREYQQSNPVANKKLNKEQVFDVLAEEPALAMTDKNETFDKIADSTYVYLKGYPNIGECHCEPCLSRLKDKKDLRNDAEKVILAYLKEIPGDREITILGSGNLLETVVLIAKLVNENPGGTLRINLIDHQYNQESTKPLLMDFVRCMKDNNVNVTVIKDSKIHVADHHNKKANFNLNISIQTDLDQYFKLNRSPTVFFASDLNMSYLQHKYVEECSEKDKAKSFVSISTQDLMHAKNKVVKDESLELELEADKENAKSMVHAFRRNSMNGQELKDAKDRKNKIRPPSVPKK